MAIRLPLQTVFTVSRTTVQAGGPTSVAGGRADAFLLPQDTDNVLVKFTASVVSGGVSATFQTSDDGGTTYYDVARTSIVSNANNAFAEWLSIPVAGVGVRTGIVAPSVVAVWSVVSFGSVYGATGRSAASALGQLQVSGLPIMGTQNRIFLIYTAAITSVLSEVVTVYANSQSATA